MTLKITTEYLDKALLAVVMHPDGKYSIADVFNKAQELIEQAEADKDIANAEAELNDYISTDEARKLGTGAEWRGATGAWYQCSEGCAYIDTWNNAVIKYRAIRKEVPAESAPASENSFFQDAEGTIPAIAAQPEPAPAVDLAKVHPEWKPGPSVFKDWCAQWFGPDSDETYLAKAVLSLPTKSVQPADPLASLPEELLTPEVKKALGEWIDSEQEPHAELRALYAQQVKDGTLGDFDWTYKYNLQKTFSPLDASCFVGGEVLMHADHDYRCTPKANLVTLDGVDMPREAAIAIWESKKDACDIWYRSVFGNWIPSAQVEFKVIASDGEYQLRPKALKDVSWLDMPVGVVVKPKNGSAIWILHGRNRIGQPTLTNKGSDDCNFFYSNFDCIELAPADQQNWLNWRGGGCPVPMGVIVEATLRSGYTVDGIAQRFTWKHGDVASDIIEYHIVGIAEGWELK